MLKLSVTLHNYFFNVMHQHPPRNAQGHLMKNIENEILKVYVKICMKNKNSLIHLFSHKGVLPWRLKLIINKLFGKCRCYK